MADPRFFHLVQRAHSALFRASDRALKRHIGVTASQLGILFLLNEDDGQPITAIADQLNMGKSSLTGLVDRMSEKGLVRRRVCPADARRVDVLIEEEGQRMVAAAGEGTKRINAALVAPFDAGERATIEKFLRYVSDHAETIVSTHGAKQFADQFAEKGL